MYLCNRHGSVKTKAFDTLKHDFLIAKLGAYRFEIEDLRYILVTKRKERARVNKSCE